MRAQPFSALLVVTLVVVCSACTTSQPFESRAPTQAPPVTPVSLTSTDERDRQQEVVNAYLVQHFGEASFGDAVFCAHETMAEAPQGTAQLQYLAILCDEYYLNDKDAPVRRGTGVGDFVVLTSEMNDGQLQVIDLQKPEGAGEQYSEAVRRLFPETLHQGIMLRTYGQGLATETRQQAEAYFQAQAPRATPSTP